MIHSREASLAYTCVVTWIIHVHHLTYIHVLGHISFTTHICTYRDMTHSSMQSYVSRHDSFMYVITHILTCRDTTHPCMSSLIYSRVETRLIHVCHHSYTHVWWHESSTYIFPHIYMCWYMIHSCMSSLIYTCAETWLIHAQHHSYTHVSRLLHACHYSCIYIHPHRFTPSQSINLDVFLIWSPFPRIPAPECHAERTLRARCCYRRRRLCMNKHTFTNKHLWVVSDTEKSFHTYGVATISSLLKMMGLLFKRALLKRVYSAKKTCHLKEPTNRSHPIGVSLTWHACCSAMYLVAYFGTHMYQHKHIYES